MPSPGITKRALAEVMKQLMAEQPLAKISVGDIVSACGLNRNSFYYHFKDKYDLVNWIFYTEFAAEVNRDEVVDSSGWTLIEAMCGFFYANKGFYINALSVSGQNSFSEYFADLMRQVVRARSDEMFTDDEDHEFYVTFFIDAFMASLFRWLTEGAKKPPAEFVRLIRKAATGAAILVLQEGEQDQP